MLDGEMPLPGCARAGLPGAEGVLAEYEALPLPRGVPHLLRVAAVRSARPHPLPLPCRQRLVTAQHAL